MKHVPFTLSVIAMVFLTIALRVYKLNGAVADWHSFRQADTASVARIFVSDGIDILHPRYHDLSNIQSGKDNPQGYRMVEVPLYQAVAAVFSRTFPRVSVDVWLRLVSIGSAAGITVLVMSFAYAFGGLSWAMWSGFFYAALPYSVFYGRAILPETFASFWALLSVYVVSKSVQKSDVSVPGIVIAGVSAAVALLSKPTAGFLLTPVPYLLWKEWKLSWKSAGAAVVFGAITLIPFLWWRQWITQYPEGIAVFDWLFNKADIRFKGAWFHWIFAQRIGTLILGVWGVILLGFGLLAPNSKKEGSVLVWWILGSLSYVSILAAGNVQHDYYQIMLVPVLSLLCGKGVSYVLGERKFSVVSRYGLVSVSVLFALAFSWFTVRTYYWINRPEIIEAGQAADRVLPKDAKVIAPYNGDTTFLYQTRRSGWPLGFDIDDKITMGATHYVTVSPTDDDFETMTLARDYTVIERNDHFAIIDLTKPKEEQHP